MNNQSEPCPCESGKPLQHCCLPYLLREKIPVTAEALMRSRYTAFTHNDEAYLRFSWHPDTCPEDIHLHAETRWLGLAIKSTEHGLQDDNNGRVEFVARYKNDGKAVRIHENSRFTRFENRWVYLDGENDN